MSVLSDLLDRLSGGSSGSSSGSTGTTPSKTDIAPGGGPAATLDRMRGTANRTYNPTNNPNVAHLAEMRQGTATSLLGFGEEAFRIRDEEDARQQEALGFLKEQNEESLQPTLTDRDIQDLFAGDTDRANFAGQDNASALRGMLGGAGITGGGGAAAMATKVNLARLGQIATAKRDLRGLRAQLDADTNIRRFQQGLSVAGMMAMGPSDTGLGALGEISGVYLTREANEQGRISAANSAQQMRWAGRDAKEAGYISGGIGLLGSALGGS